MNSSTCFELIEALSNAQTVEEIHSICVKLCGQFEFDYFIYAARLPTSFIQPFLTIVSGFPTEWWERYKKLDYRQIDPALAHCSTQSIPLNWSSLKLLEEKDQRIQRFMTESRDFGLKSGASFPVHSAQGEAAMLSLVSTEDTKEVQSRIAHVMPFAQLATAYIHEAVRRVIEIKEIGPGKAHLTEREKECLLWAAEGKTSWETSQILGISERTVVFHLQNVTTKLGVANRQQAVARAVSMGLIVPQLIQLHPVMEKT